MRRSEARYAYQHPPVKNSNFHYGENRLDDPGEVVLMGVGVPGAYDDGRARFTGELDVLLLPPDRVDDHAAVIAEVRQLDVAYRQTVRLSR